MAIFLYLSTVQQKPPNPRSVINTRPRLTSPDWDPPPRSVSFLPNQAAVKMDVPTPPPLLTNRLHLVLFRGNIGGTVGAREGGTHLLGITSVQ